MRNWTGKGLRSLVWIVLGVLSMAAGVASAGSSPNSTAVSQGVWIVAEGRTAPWVTSAMTESVDESLLLGSPVEFSRSEISSPSVLKCENARFEERDLPAEGLFEGQLPRPADGSARGLGFTKFPVPTLRVTCKTGVFDYHRLDADHLLIAVDNVIWTLVPMRDK